jgi:hypothetical protein
LADSPSFAPTDFTWFIPEPEAPPEPVSYAYTAVGLPRRVPRAHAVPILVEQPTPAPPAATAAPTAQRNPSRARGFLNDYQAGVRQAARHNGEDR